MSTIKHIVYIVLISLTGNTNCLDQTLASYNSQRKNDRTFAVIQFHLATYTDCTLIAMHTLFYFNLRDVP